MTPRTDGSRRAAPTRPITAGKYLISPITTLLDNGWYACSVSIRSGSGSATTDRIVRLTRLFRTGVRAAEYAIAEGLQWIGASPSLARIAA
jgi:hypothetical protein